LRFSAKQHTAIKRWISRDVALKGLFFRSVEYRYMDPVDVLSGAGTRIHGGRFVPVGTRAVYLSTTDSGASKEVTARKSRLGGVVIRSFLTPADRPIAMVATEDIGRIAAELIQQVWTGKRVVELEGPARVSPNDLAKAFANELGHPVRVEIVARDTWETLFRGQGMKNHLLRMRMLDGFNEGWIDSPGNGDLALKGIVSAETVISNLVKSTK
jgi:hypothetical protein